MIVCRTAVLAFVALALVLPCLAQDGVDDADARVDEVIQLIAARDPLLAGDLDSSREVVAACLATWHHGITREDAQSVLPPHSEWILERLLLTPEFPRHDNVVAFLAWLGDDDSGDALASFAAAPATTTWTAESERALLMSPRALGHVAAAGHPVAARRLLELASEDGPALTLAVEPPGMENPRLLRAQVLEMALRSLPLVPGDEAVARLAEVASGRVHIPSPVRDMAAVASSVLAHGAGAPDVENLTQPSLDGDTAAPALADPEPRLHDGMLTWVNHAGLTPTQRMTPERLDEALAMSSLRMGREDFDGDTACCVRLRRSGGDATFGVAQDGRDVIDDGIELASVLNDPAARIKVVRLINYCGGTAMNILGCAWVGGHGVAIVRHTSLNVEAIAWAHEYGHNVGLSHAPDSRFMMAALASGQNNGIAETECAAYHDPPTFSHPIQVDAGDCADTDGDGVHDGVDNCTLSANLGQADLDGDGIGDVCDCDPANAVVVEDDRAHDLRVAGSGLVSWSMPAAASSTSLLSGTLTTLRADRDTSRIRCLASHLAAPSHDDVRPVGSAGFYYLAQSHSACGSSDMGADSLGKAHVGSGCP